VPGIVDADSSRILFVDTRTGAARTLDIRIRNRQTSQVTIVNLPGAVRRAFLTSHGAIVLADNPNSGNDELWEWRDGALLDLGSATRLVYESPYALWNEGAPDDRHLVRRNLSTGTDVSVTTTATNTGFDVGPNGDVVFSRVVSGASHVFRYHNGITAQNSGTLPSREESNPYTDGLHVVYRTSPCCRNPSGNWGLAETGDGGEADLGLTIDAPENQYAVTGGWTAFVQRITSTSRGVMLRDPQAGGSIVYAGQQTSTGLPTPIALNPNGQAIVVDSSGGPFVPYIARVGSGAHILNPPQMHGNSRGVAADWADWVGDAWYAAAGATLYKLGSNYKSAISSAPGLIAWWRLGDGSGSTAKDEKGAHPGTYDGDFQHGGDSAVVGDYDPSARFPTGAGRVKVPSLGATSTFTIEGWTNLDPSAGDNPYGNNAVFASNTVRLIARPNGVYADLIVGGEKRAVMQAVTPGTNISQWVHWAFVRDGAHTLLWRNGIVISTTDDAPATPTTLAGSLGAQASPAPNAFSYPLHGELDEVTVYDRALSSEAVQSHYRAGWG
jgi:hypothetical protein